MDASAVMTHSVVTVAPGTPLTEVAKIMVEQRISAAPVLDGEALVGIVSESDLLRRAEIGTERPRRRWVELVLSTGRLAADYLKEHGRTAADVMTHDVVTVDPSTDAAEIARILETKHIKRVPVVAGGRVVGIVSRANLVQALASSGKGSLPQVTRNDAEIQKALTQAMTDRRWSRQTNAVVREGVVHLWGFVDTDTERRAVAVLAESIPGVRRVEDHLEYTPIMPAF